MTRLITPILIWLAVRFTPQQVIFDAEQWQRMAR